MRRLCLTTLLIACLAPLAVRAEAPASPDDAPADEALADDAPADDAPADPAPTAHLLEGNRSPFEVTPEVEIPAMLALTAVATLPRLLGAETLASRCGLDCDPQRVHSFDRWAIGLNIKGANAASDVIMVGAMATPYLVNFIDVAAHRGGLDGWEGYAKDTLVLTETLAAAVATTNLLGFVIRRPRPYVYDPDLSSSFRLNPIGQLSFPSGHSTVVMAMSVAGARLLQARHPGHPVVAVAWVATALSGAATFVLRPLASQHFPSDVLAGTLTGLGLGLLVPALHERAWRARQRAIAAGRRPPRVRLHAGGSRTGGRIGLSMTW